MKSYYDIVVQLEVFHDYFPLEEGHVCTSLRFYPSDECLRKIQENRLIFKNTINGFVLVGEKKNLGTDALPNLVPLVDIAVGTKFYFLITEENNGFINITDTDPKLFSDGKKYVFRNTNTNAAVVNGNIATVTIHNNTPLTNAVMMAPVNFIAPVVLADNPAKLVLRDSEGGFIMEITVPRDGGGNISAERLLLSDAPFSEGLYTLQQVNGANAVVSEKKYFLISSIPPFTVNGIVLIDYNNILSAQAAKEVHAVIQLSPRSIHWIYNVDIERYEDQVEFNTKRIKPADLQVDVTFAGPQFALGFANPLSSESPIPSDWYINGKASFRSNNAVPLQKKPYTKLLLKNTAAITPVIINNMPNPDPLMIKETLPNTYEAEIFLKVK